MGNQWNHHQIPWIQLLDVRQAGSRGEPLANGILWKIKMLFEMLHVK
jgi:hypothetical protein